MKKSKTKLFLLLAWKTGGRKSGVAALRWGEIQQEHDGWYVQLDDKTGLRRVAISPDVAAEVASHRPEGWGPQTRLFSEGYQPWGALRRVQERKGIPVDRHITPHGLRRRWSLDQIEAGVPVHVYADQSGHSPKIALEHYARVTDRDRRAAATRVEDHLDLYAWLGDRGLSPRDAVEIIEAHLESRQGIREIKAEG